MSKLVSLDRFGKSPRKSIVLPFPADEIQFAVTVYLLKNGRVELQGPVNHKEPCQKLLALGIQRMETYHALKKPDATAPAEPAVENIPEEVKVNFGPIEPHEERESNP